MWLSLWYSKSSNGGVHIQFVKSTEWCYLLFKVGNEPRVEVYGTKKRYNIKGPLKSLPVGEQLMLRHGWTVVLIEDVDSHKFHSGGKE